MTEVEPRFLFRVPNDPLSTRAKSADRILSLPHQFGRIGTLNVKQATMNRPLRVFKRSWKDYSTTSDKQRSVPEAARGPCCALSLGGVRVISGPLHGVITQGHPHRGNINSHLVPINDSSNNSRDRPVNACVAGFQQLAQPKLHPWQ
jgi:hypothetical protein